MKTKRFLAAIIALILVMTTLLTSCSWFKKDPQGPDGETEGSTAGVPGECSHENTILKDKKDATCISVGYSGDKICSDCNKVLETGSEIAATGEHKYDDGVVTKLSTCVQEGVKTFTCIFCHVTKTETVPLSDVCSNEFHFESDYNHRLLCTNCHKSSSGAHTQGEKVADVAATCTEGAYTIYTCLDCKENYKAYNASAPALGHEWDIDNPVIVNPTCKTPGERYITCKHAGCEEKTAQIALPATVSLHNYTVESSSAATCSEEGFEMLVCADCGVKLRKTLPKPQHEYGTPVIDGNWSRQTCKTCGHNVSVFNASGEVQATLNTNDIDSDKAFKIQLANADIEFPAGLVESMKYNNDVTIGAGAADKNAIVDAMGDISDEDKNALLANNANIYDFTVEGIESEFSEKVTVTLNYTLQDGEDREGIVIWYLSDEGEIVAVDNVNFIDEDGDGTGIVIFEVEHFSHYAVAYKETQEMKCRRGVHDMGNEDRMIVVDPSCTGLGYTYKVCSCCGHTDVTDYKMPTGHDFGEKLQPNVTCENGGYVHQECSKCHAHLNYEYVPAKGHTPVGHATCTEAATCSDCFKIIVPAYGHAWTEWEIVTEPTADKEGLKRRYCPRCGEVKSVTISLNSDVSKWEYDSLTDLIDILLGELIPMDNGTAAFVVSAEGPNGETISYKINITLNRTDKKLNAKFNIVATGIEGTTGPQEANFYYIDGQLFGVYDNKQLVVSAEDLLPIPLDKLIAEAQLYIYAADEIFGDVLGVSSQLANIIVDSYGEEINAALKESGSSYTAESLIDTVNAIQYFYAYYLTKLGLDTDIALPNIDGGASVQSLLGMFMKKTEADGKITYTYDMSEYNKAMTTMLDEIEKKLDLTLAQLIYDTFGDTIKKTYPEITDFDKLIAHLKKEYTGTTQVKKLVDKVAAIVAEGGKYTLDDVYKQIEELLKNFGVNVELKTIVDEFSSKTLDSLVKEMMGPEDTVDQLYDSISEMLKQQKLGEIVVERYGNDIPAGGSEDDYEEIVVTVKDKITETREQLKKNTQSGTFTIVFSEDGKLISASASANATITQQSGNGEEYAIKGTVTIDVKADANAKVTLPEELSAYLNNGLSFKTDSNGNLIISGIPNGANTGISFEGSANASLDTLVTRDEELSKSNGYDIYILNENLWEADSLTSEFAIDASGKLYRLEHFYKDQIDIVKKAPFFDAVSNPAAQLPASGEVTTTYFTTDRNNRYEADASTATPLYMTVFGYVYQEGGVWYLIDSEQSNSWDYWTDKNGNTIFFYEKIVSYPYTETVSNMVISNSDSGYSNTAYDTDGKIVEIDTLYVTFDENKDNFRLNFTIQNGQIILVSLANNSYSGYYLGSEFDGEYDYYYTHGYNEDRLILDKNGNALSGYQMATLYKRYPSYYEKYDGVYFKVKNINGRVSNPSFTYADVSGLSTMKLSDGRTFYVAYEEGNVASAARVYGYINVRDELYAQACVVYSNSEEISVNYRDMYYSYRDECAGSHFNVYSSKIEQILTPYLTKNADGTYTFSAEGLKLAEQLCTSGNDLIFLMVSLDAEVDGKSVSMMANHPIAFTPIDSTPVIGAQSSTRFDWDYLGNSSSNVPSLGNDLITTPNKDGSITISNEEGGYLDFSIEFNKQNKVNIDQFVRYDENKSTEKKINIYSASGIFNRRTSYAYYGGRYYNFEDWMDIIKTHYADDYSTIDLTKLIAKNYTLSDIDYKYDELNEDGSLGGRIYQTRIRFTNGCTGTFYHSDYIDCYVKINDSKIYVLTDVSTDTDSLLVYENEVLLTDFVNALKIKNEGSYAYDSGSYLSNGKQIKSSYLSVYYNDECMCGISMYSYTQGNSQVYVAINNYTTEYQLDLTSEDIATLPKDWIELRREVETYGTISIEMAYGIYTEEDTEYFVKIGDQYLSYDHYLRRRESEDKFLDDLSSRTYIHAVKTSNGYKYYEKFEINTQTGTIIPYNEIELSETDKVTLGDHQGYDENGNSVYHCNLWMTSEIQEITLSDGTVVYYNHSADSTAYALMGDGYYYPGVIVDGTSFIPYAAYGSDYEYYTLSNELIAYSIGLYDCIIRDGHDIIIKSEILDVISNYESMFNNFYIVNMTEGNQYYIDIYDLRNLFN